MRRRPDYVWLEHTADIRLRISGDSEGDLYASAALALTELIAERPEVDGEEPVTFSVTGSDPAERLFEVLRELLFRFDVDATLLVAAEAECVDDEVRLTGRAIRFDPNRHVGLREVKAVTYHELRVQADESGWSATVVFDV